MSLAELKRQIRINPFHPSPYIRLASYHLEEGNEGEARKIILKRRQMPNQEALHYAKWAELCEGLGMSRQAVECWEKALAQDSKNGEYFCRLGILYYEAGNLEKAMRLQRKSLDYIPSYLNAKRVLADIYEDLGDQGSAKSLRKDFALVESKKEIPRETDLLIMPKVSQEDANYFLNIFKGKEVGYATQTFDQAGRVTFTYFDSPLNTNYIINHILGKLTLGVYPFRKDKTLKYAAIKAKINSRKAMENYKNKSYLVLMEEKVHDYILKIALACQRLNLPSYLEDAGEHDRRLWFFFDEFLPYQLIKRFLDSLLDKMFSPQPDIKVETLLGLEAVGVGWEQSPVLLPLGINQKTGKRCLFLDFHDKPHTNQLEYIRKVRFIKGNNIKEFLNSINKEIRGIEKTIPTKPEIIENIQHNCPVLGEIINKARSGRSLSHQEKLILYFSLGLVDDQRQSIHHVLEMTPDYRPQKVDRLLSQLKSNPISCPKIRELLPEVTAYTKCDCAFSIPEGGYPTPLLYIDPKLVEGKRDEMLASPHSVQEAARRYISLHKEVKGLKKSMYKLERVILPMFNQKKIDRVSTPLGCLKKIVDGENTQLVVEL